MNIEEGQLIPAPKQLADLPTLSRVGMGHEPDGLLHYFFFAQRFCIALVLW